MACISVPSSEIYTINTPPPPGGQRPTGNRPAPSIGQQRNEFTAPPSGQRPRGNRLAPSIGQQRNEFTAPPCGQPGSECPAPPGVQPGNDRPAPPGVQTGNDRPAPPGDDGAPPRDGEGNHEVRPRRRHPPPGGKKRRYHGCAKLTRDVLKRRWIYLVQGVIVFILGLILGIIYFCIRGVTSTLQYIETLPSYIPSILLMMSGILAGLLFWKRDNLLVIGALFLCLASTIICTACSVFALLHHIPHIKSQTLCTTKEVARQCHCYSNSFQDMTLYTYYDITHCDLLHTQLLDYLYTQCGLYIITGLVCLTSAVFHVLLLRFNAKIKGQKPTSPRRRLRPRLEPVDIEHLANIHLLRGHMTRYDQSELMPEEYANENIEINNVAFVDDTDTIDNVVPPSDTADNQPSTSLMDNLHGDMFSRFISLPGEPRVCLLGIRKRDSIAHGTVQEEPTDQDDLPVGTSARDLVQGHHEGQRSVGSHSIAEQMLTCLELYHYQNQRNLMVANRNQRQRHSLPSLSQQSVTHSNRRHSATIPDRPIHRCRCHDLPRQPLPRQHVHQLPPRPITRSTHLQHSLPSVPLRRGYPFCQNVAPHVQDFLEQCSRYSHTSDMPRRRPSRGNYNRPPRQARSCCSDDVQAFRYLPEFFTLPEEPPPPYSLSPPYDNNENLPDYSSGHGSFPNREEGNRTVRRITMPETEL